MEMSQRCFDCHTTLVHRQKIRSDVVSHSVKQHGVQRTGRLAFVTCSFRTRERTVVGPMTSSATRPDPDVKRVFPRPRRASFSRTLDGLPGSFGPPEFARGLREGIAALFSTTPRQQLDSNHEPIACLIAGVEHQRTSPGFRRTRGPRMTFPFKKRQQHLTFCCACFAARCTLAFPYLCCIDAVHCCTAPAY